MRADVVVICLTLAGGWVLAECLSRVAFRHALRRRNPAARHAPGDLIHLPVVVDEDPADAFIRTVPQPVRDYLLNVAREADAERSPVPDAVLALVRRAAP